MCVGENMAKQHQLHLPAISTNVELGDSKKLRSKRIYIYPSSVESKPYIGVYLGQAFVYLSEAGLHRIYVRTVSGIRNLYVDNRYIAPIHGRLDSLLYHDPLIVMVIGEEREAKALIVLHGREKIYELRSITKGFLSKYECRFTNIYIGLAGDRFYGVIKLSLIHI